MRDSKFPATKTQNVYRTAHTSRTRVTIRIYLQKTPWTFELVVRKCVVCVLQRPYNLVSIWDQFWGLSMTLILALCSQIFEKIACTFDRHALITFNRLVQKKELQKKKTETPDHYCPFWRPVDDGDVFATRASPAALGPVEPKNWPCHPFMAVSMIVLQINMCHSSGYCMRRS